MAKKVTLKNIADIYSGYTFRGAIEPALGGVTSVLQAKDVIQSEPIVSTENLVKISLELPRSNSYVVNGDILLVSRATGPGNFRATTFEGFQKNVIASSSLFIIRIVDKHILPEYVSLYLNSLEGQNDLAQRLSGSYIKSVPRKNLQELQIPIPPLHIQKRLVDIHENVQGQKRILERKIQINKNIINQVFKTINV